MGLILKISSFALGAIWSRMDEETQRDGVVCNTRPLLYYRTRQILPTLTIDPTPLNCAEASAPGAGHGLAHPHHIRAAV